MTQITIRIPSLKLDQKLRSLAAERGWSLNQAGNYLMKKGAGLLDDPNGGRIGNQLDEFIGSWSSKEADEMLQVVSDEFGGIDEELWK